MLPSTENDNTDQAKKRRYGLYSELRSGPCVPCLDNACLDSQRGVVESTTRSAEGAMLGRYGHEARLSTGTRGNSPIQMTVREPHLRQEAPFSSLA